MKLLEWLHQQFGKKDAEIFLSKPVAPLFDPTAADHDAVATACRVKQEALALLTEGTVTMQGRTVDDAIRDKPREIPPELIEAADIDWSRGRVSIGMTTFFGCTAVMPANGSGACGRPRGSLLKEAASEALELAQREGINKAEAARRIAPKFPGVEAMHDQEPWQRIHKEMRRSR